MGEHLVGEYKTKKDLQVQLAAPGSQTHCMFINVPGAWQPLLAAQLKEEHGLLTGQGQ